MRETDRNFLDDLAREKNQDEHGDGSPLPAPARNVVNAETIGVNLKSEEKRQQKEAGMRPERKDAHRPHWR